MEVKKIKHETLNFYFYNDLPPTARKANKEDFYNPNGKIKIGFWYLLHGYHENKYEAYQTTNTFDINNIMPWLNDGRVYVVKQ